MTRLDYETPPPNRRSHWAPNLALAISASAALALAVSVVMYASVMGGTGIFGVAQRSLAWISIVLAAAGVVSTLHACFVGPRGTRLWFAVAALFVYALIFAGVIAAFGWS